MSKLLVFSLLMFSFLLGSVLRLYRLTEVPTGLIQDEAVAGYDAYALGSTGKDHHGATWPVTFQTFNDWTGHSFNYQLIPFVKIFGVNIFAVRFAVAFFSILTIFFIYLLGKTLTGSEIVALIMTFLFSFSYFSVASSRWAIPPNTVAFFVTLSLYLFFACLNRPSHHLLWGLAGLSFGIALYSYPSVEGFLPLWLVGSVIIIITTQPRQFRKRLMTSFAAFFILFIITALPLIVDHLERPETITTKLSMISVVTQPNNPLTTFLGNYFSYLLPGFLFLPADINPVRAIPGFGYENILLGVFYYLGIIILLFKKNDLIKLFPKLNRGKIYCLLWYFIIFPLIPSITLPAGNFQRAVYIIPFMIFSVSIGLVYCFVKLKQLNLHLVNKYHWLLAVLLIGSVYLYFQFRFYNYYFGPKYQAYTQWYFQYGLDKVINYTSKNEANYTSIIIDSTINMPYIYVLFYKKVDPALLNYQDFAGIDKQTSWLSVKKYNSYIFRKITSEDLTGSRLLTTIYNSPFSNYAIYQKGDELVVRFEVIKRN